MCPHCMPPPRPKRVANIDRLARAALQWPLMPITRTRAARHPTHRTLTGRPIITLTTDFGLTDSYVAAMKAVLLRNAAEARLIDVTHQVPPQDVLCGSITLE